MDNRIVINSWAGAMERAKARAEVTDLPEAIQLFRDATGQEPTHVFINHKNYREFEKAVPEGMALEIHGGCGLWEIMIGCDHPVFAVPDAPPNPADNAPDEDLSPSTPSNGVQQGERILKHKNKEIKGQKKPVKAKKRRKKRILKHGKRGRPRKTGGVSRTTGWRRRKEEEQLRMAI